MDGLLLVDKPLGFTSHDAVAYIRRVLGEKRIGHTGTLDPEATGLLLLLVGKASRLARFFELDYKKYRAVMRLGAETDTQDKAGQVVCECPVPELEPAGVEEVFRRFTGIITQVPPIYSALKQGGVPLYKLARAGGEVERKPRQVTVEALVLLCIDGPEIEFEAHCSKGTYIRTLASDMGRALGSCAHLTALRRISVGGYNVEDALAISARPDKVEAQGRLIPIDRMLPWLPGAVVSDDAARRVMDGRSPEAGEYLVLPSGLGEGAAVRVLSETGAMLAVAESAGDAAVPLRLKVVLV